MDRTNKAGHKPSRSAKVEQRREAGRECRRKVPLKALAEWQPSHGRRDPVDILIEQGRTRIPELLPLRYRRMKPNAFTFLRGAAAVMAADLGAMPATGLRVQSGGDSHLDNFGAYELPEGTPVFDINDFDETLPAPFEWDVKRLAASLAVRGRIGKLAEQECRELARLAARNYRRSMARLAQMPPLEAWSIRIDLAGAIAEAETGNVRHDLRDRLHAIVKSNKEHFDLVERHAAGLRIKEKDRSVLRLSAEELHETARQAFASYAETLAEERQILLQRYELRDVAFKVVGVGSVATFCAIALLVSDDGAPLLLQIKEAQESVLASYAGPSRYPIHGERVVVGQRMLQAAADIFLGWTKVPIDGRLFYVRRLKDYQLASVGHRLEAALPFYAALCGRTLARAHARSGDAVAISAYIGEGNDFDKAITDFATAYAGQTERDWHIFIDAIKAGRISAQEAAAAQSRR